MTTPPRLHIASRALAALLVLCLHAPLWTHALGVANEANLPEPGEVSPRRVH